MDRQGELTILLSLVQGVMNNNNNKNNIIIHMEDIG
jgi:hypothetical protein